MFAEVHQRVLDVAIGFGLGLIVGVALAFCWLISVAVRFLGAISGPALREAPHRRRRPRA